MDPSPALTGFTLFMLVFGGALYAGRTGHRATQAAIALLLATAVLQILNVLGVAALEGPACGPGAHHRPRRPRRDASPSSSVNHDATADSLVGAIFGYFVIATACALLFRQMEGAHPGSFRLPEGGDLDTQMLYFSLITVTTAGYGDITPVTSVAQISAALEAALGTLYLAILIGRIVGQLAPGLGRPGSARTERAPSHPGIERDSGRNLAGHPEDRSAADSYGSSTPRADSARPASPASPGSARAPRPRRARS